MLKVLLQVARSFGSRKGMNTHRMETADTSLNFLWASSALHTAKIPHWFTMIIF